MIANTEISQKLLEAIKEFITDGRRGKCRRQWQHSSVPDIYKEA